MLNPLQPFCAAHMHSSEVRELKKPLDLHRSLLLFQIAFTLLGRGKFWVQVRSVVPFLA
jgi:hypothetical protein